MQYPIWKSKVEDKSVQLQVSNELFTSFGKNVVLSYFNQNRVFVGILLTVHKNWNAAFGYTEIFRSTSEAGHYIKIHAPTININHKLDFSKNK
jgi:hypothetical protein